MIKQLTSTSSLALIMAGASVNAAPYTADYDSLAKHTAAPEWFQDSKLGIYFHWGVYSVPAFGSEWYPFYMNRPENWISKHHRKKYGDPKTHPYHDFVPGFTGEHFDAEEWAQLFADSGARFAGPVAEHHDGFSMWDSEITPWNAMDRGPKKDVLGDLFKELKTHDIRTLATFHHARNLQRYPSIDAPANDSKEFKGHKGRSNSHFQNWKGWPTASDDPELQLLYGNMPKEKWEKEVWTGKLNEVIAKYQPDIIWFDSWLDQISEKARKEFSAHYLNEAQKWEREVVIIRKQNDLPASFTVNDHEKSREAKAAEHSWMTDDTISYGSWSYTESLKIKPLSVVVHNLIDTVSKNGVVLLNLSPKADGTIPQDQRQVLRGLGRWLQLNGEAIYGTRIWDTFGEGPTKEPAGGFKDHKKFDKIVYSAADVRYTRSKDHTKVYAMILGLPKAGEKVTLKAFTKAEIGNVPAVKSVILLDGKTEISFKQTEEGLVLTMPEKLPEASALAFRVTLKK